MDLNSIRCIFRSTAAAPTGGNVGRLYQRAMTARSVPIIPPDYFLLLLLVTNMRPPSVWLYKRRRVTNVFDLSTSYFAVGTDLTSAFLSSHGACRVLHTLVISHLRLHRAHRVGLMASKPSPLTGDPYHVTQAALPQLFPRRHIHLSR